MACPDFELQFKRLDLKGTYLHFRSDNILGVKHVKKETAKVETETPVRSTFSNADQSRSSAPSKLALAKNSQGLLKSSSRSKAARVATIQNSLPTTCSQRLQNTRREIDSRSLYFPTRPATLRPKSLGEMSGDLWNRTLENTAYSVCRLRKIEGAGTLRTWA